MKRLTLNIFLVLLALPALLPLPAQAADWPRTLPLEQGFITIYAPQVDEFDRSRIKFRSALAYRENAEADPVFGAGWFESPVQADSNGQVVLATNLAVTETRFPAGTEDVEFALALALARESSAGSFEFSIAEIEASLKATEAESLALDKLNTDPPRIIYRDRPALLLSLDGEPVLRDIENSPYQAVINTPYPLISDGKYYYLNAAKGAWYRAREATGPYRFESRPPAAITALVKDDETVEQQTDEPITAANAPEVVVSTEPAELVVTDGPAAFVPLVDDLLVLQNSDDDVFMHVSSQQFYIVLAGRWYEASSLDGPWSYRPADELPIAFANIPSDSEQADSRVYVAGTDEAREAILDAQVPQTAAIARGEVDVDVDYDGDPTFQPVDGADMTYATNTGSTVILANGNYYLVDEGVWYLSSSPNGPWQVSDHRPPQVIYVRPTSPVYNVRYVYVYDSTPDVVYVGYTPGYMGSYVYRNTLVYGSGWYYAPWVSPYYYYPRHSTWGFNVSYNSWSGWNFGLSWGWGPFSVGFYTGGYWHHHHHWHHRHYGRWGPGRYRPRPYHGGRGGHHRPRQEHYAGRNLYRDGRQRARVADTRDVRPVGANIKGRDSRSRDYRSVKYAQSGPVKANSIKQKADIRDVNAKARRNRLLADNGGKVYRKPGRIKTGNDLSQGKAMPAKNRKKPVTVKKSAASNQRPAKSTVTRQTKTISASGKRTVSKQKSRNGSSENWVTRMPASKTRATAYTQKQARPEKVQQPAKQQTVHKQSGQQAVPKQSWKQRSAPVKQAPQKSQAKSFTTRQKSKMTGGNKTGDGLARQRSKRD